MQINGFSDFAARIACLGGAIHQPVGPAVGKDAEDRAFGDRISFSGEGLRSLQEQVRETEESKDADRLARNGEVDGYLKSAYVALEAMRDLARLAQDENLTDEDRLKLDTELTNLQAEFAKKTGKFKLVLDGRSTVGDADMFDKVRQGVERDRNLAAAVLTRGYERRMRGVGDNNLYMDNGDGTSSVMSLWKDGFGHGSAEVDVYANSRALAEILSGSLLSPETAMDDAEWAALTRQAEDLRAKYGDSLIPDVPKDDGDLASLRKKQNEFVKVLTHDEFADRFAVLSLRSVDNARKAEETLTAALDGLSEMGERLDAAYDTIQAVKDKRAADPNGYSRMGELNRLFKPLDDLWRISRLWDDGTAKYLIV